MSGSSKTGPKTAMVMAAGLGTRMRPLTNDRPKALVEVGGRALIDHVLDRLEAAGVERAVVNVHAFADRLEAHLARRRSPDIVISDERDQLMETGGGLKQARPLVGEAPIWMANIDSVWIERSPVLDAVIRAWDPEHMDSCLLLARMEESIGFEGGGDAFLAADGRLSFRGEAPSAPYAYAGFQIVKPQIVDDGPDGPFKMNLSWRPRAAEGRLHGAVLDGLWIHVSDPSGREAAEARLLAGAEG